ncbi:RPAP1-like protein [Xylariaceae sp. FL0016]|nr:RPAP1-like protein [Xylariaceae sp. FL0016]
MDPTFMISDVLERETTQPKAPSFPQSKSTTTGFPEHKKRNKVSAFKQKRQGVLSEDQRKNVFVASSSEPLGAPNQATAAKPPTKLSATSERESIHRENTAKIDSMSPREIEEARKELFNGLDPSILQMLLKRANLDDGANALPLEDSTPEIARPTSNEPESQNREKGPKDVFAEPEDSEKQNASRPRVEETPRPSDNPKKVRFASVVDEANEPSALPEPSIPKIQSVTQPDAPTSDQTVPSFEDDQGPKPHFPHPPQNPSLDLDSNDPDFLASLHEKYFPNLPADPSKLAWMAPIPSLNSPADYDSPYHPSQLSLPISALRFDFRGALLPPRISRAIPPSKGLHHHGEAPEAAGYTVRELARLCRSAVPGQRCIAYQTLGRILYRLGRGEFGAMGDDMATGIWRQMEEGAVMRSLTDEAGIEEGRGHRSAKAFATEAIWLFEKGGWKEKLRRAK